MRRGSPAAAFGHRRRSTGWRNEICGTSLAVGRQGVFDDGATIGANGWRTCCMRALIHSPQKNYFLRCRIFARMRRFFRPIFLRPFPVRFVPTPYSPRSGVSIRYETSALQSPDLWIPPTTRHMATTGSSLPGPCMDRQVLGRPR
jgi:hypothetical protein